MSCTLPKLCTDWNVHILLINDLSLCGMSALQIIKRPVALKKSSNRPMLWVRYVSPYQWILPSQFHRLRCCWRDTCTKCYRVRYADVTSPPLRLHHESRLVWSLVAPPEKKCKLCMTSWTLNVSLSLFSHFSHFWNHFSKSDECW